MRIFEFYKHLQPFLLAMIVLMFCTQNRDYNRSPTSVGSFDVNGAAHVASRMLAAILLASKNGEFDRVLLGSSLQKLDYQ